MKYIFCSITPSLAYPDAPTADVWSVASYRLIIKTGNSYLH